MNLQKVPRARTGAKGFSVHSWRTACPEGHVNIEKRQGAISRKYAGGGSDKRIIEYHMSGGKYNGDYYCETCNKSYMYLIDKKTGKKCSP